MVPDGASLLMSFEHSLVVFLQQVAFCFMGVEAFKINRLAINIAAIKPTLIQCLVRMVVVLGWDESN